jgi:catalase
LKGWIINNWRPYGKADIGKRHRKLSYIDILCRTRTADVEAEINMILVEEELERTPDHVFQQRKKAARRIYERMDNEEKQDLRKMVAAQAESGNTREIRER